MPWNGLFFRKACRGADAPRDLDDRFAASLHRYDAVNPRIAAPISTS